MTDALDDPGGEETRCFRQSAFFNQDSIDPEMVFNHDPDPDEIFKIKV